MPKALPEDVNRRSENIMATRKKNKKTKRQTMNVRIAPSLVFCVVFSRSLFVFSGVRVALSLVFCVVLCRLLFVLVVFNTTQKTKDGAIRTPLKTNNNLQNTTQKTKDRAT
jgi:hypothetical protein